MRMKRPSRLIMATRYVPAAYAFWFSTLGLMRYQFSADFVIGADGVRSKARELVLGYDDKPKSSGYAVFRSWCVISHLYPPPWLAADLCSGSQTQI